MRMMVFVILMDVSFVPMHEHRHAIAENCEHRANRNCNYAHSPHMHPEGNFKRCSRCSGYRSAKSRKNAHSNQKRRRTDWELLHPLRQTLEGSFEIEQMRSPAIDPIAEHRRKHQTDSIDN